MEIYRILTCQSNVGAALKWVLHLLVASVCRTLQTDQSQAYRQGNGGG